MPYVHEIFRNPGDMAQIMIHSVEAVHPSGIILKRSLGISSMMVVGPNPVVPDGFVMPTAEDIKQFAPKGDNGASEPKLPHETLSTDHLDEYARVGARAFLEVVRTLKELNTDFQLQFNFRDPNSNDTSAPSAEELAALTEMIKTISTGGINFSADQIEPVKTVSTGMYL